MNALWVILYIGLVAGVGGAAYYVGTERGEDRGREEAELSADEVRYFDAGIARLVQLGYTWDGIEWSSGTSADTAPNPSPTRIPDRTSCEEIDGTPYRSPAERVFFLSECVSVSITPIPVQECGQPSNPWCYDLFPGELIESPPAEFCGYFECVDNFWVGTGYVVRCQNNLFSKTGGTSEACTGNGGVLQPLYAH